MRLFLEFSSNKNLPWCILDSKLVLQEGVGSSEDSWLNRNRERVRWRRLAPRPARRLARSFAWPPCTDPPTLSSSPEIRERSKMGNEKVDARSSHNISFTIISSANYDSTLFVLEIHNFLSSCERFITNPGQQTSMAFDKCGYFLFAP